jgi:hypothetical protein
MKYKTIFVDAPMAKAKGTWGMSFNEPNGDQLARDIQAVILENVMEGFELTQSLPVTSSSTISGAYAYSFTSGVILIFKQQNP